jgi:hypothetical protein
VTPDERVRRIGRNEALYRAANERIEELNRTLAAVTQAPEDFVVVCECGDITCAEQFVVPIETYERARADAALFLIRPGHEAADVERVVEKQQEFWVIQKLPGKPESIAEETDPRS